MKEAIRKTVEVVGEQCSTLSIRKGTLFEMGTRVVRKPPGSFPFYQTQLRMSFYQQSANLAPNVTWKSTDQSVQLNSQMFKQQPHCSVWWNAVPEGNL